MMPFSTIKKLSSTKIVCCFAIVTSFASTRADENLKRSWGIQDSIATQYYVNLAGSHTNNYLDPGEKAKIVSTSPDGKYAYCITRRGVYESDAVEYRVIVFRTAEIRDRILAGEKDLTGIATAAEATIVTREPERAGIEDDRWSSDGSITFLGRRGDSRPQVFKLKVSTGELRQLTAAEEEIVRYDVHGATTFYTVRESKSRAIKYPICEADLDANGMPTLRVPELGRIFSGGFFLKIESESIARALNLEDAASAPLMSPDGNYIVYGLADRTGQRGTDATRSEVALIDIRSGKREILNVVRKNLTIADNRRHRFRHNERRRPWFMWSMDGKQLLLFDYVLASSSQAVPGILSYNLNNRVYVPIATYGPTYRDYSVDQLAGNFTLWDEGGTAGSVFSHVNGCWQADIVQVTVNAVESLDFDSPESPTHPPVLLARLGERSALLRGIQTALQDVHIARPQSITFYVPDGRMGHALLYLPHQIASEKQPLIVQITSANPDRFLPDAETSCGSSTQLFVAAGMAVVTLDPAYIPEVPYETEGDRFIRAFEALVDACKDAMVLDRSRIGAVGFSRQGYRVLYGITHPNEISLAAAVALDSYRGDYSYYLRELAVGTPPALLEQFEGATGGSFWERKAKWLQWETTFNVDRVRTPLLSVVHADNAYKLDVDQSIIGAFARNRKPLEYLIISQNAHNLQLPLAREAEMRATVEWFAFWLLGRMPADSGRVARWTMLKALQDRVVQAPVEPQGKWAFISDKAN